MSAEPFFPRCDIKLPSNEFYKSALHLEGGTVWSIFSAGIYSSFKKPRQGSFKKPCLGAVFTFCLNVAVIRFGTTETGCFATFSHIWLCATVCIKVISCVISIQEVRYCLLKDPGVSILQTTPIQNSPDASIAVSNSSGLDRLSGPEMSS